MKADVREIIFLNRAYNDLDIQMSLVDAFGADGRFHVRVIGYPCDGDVGEPGQHEAAPYMKARRGISFETVMDSKAAPLSLRMLYGITRALGAVRRDDIAQARVLAWPLKLVHVGLLKILRQRLMRPLPWLETVAAEWNPVAIVIDEAYAQPGRSAMIDKVLPGIQDRRGVPVYMIQTGHNIYHIPEPGGRRPQYKRTAARRYFMPSELDREINRGHFPDERHEVAGNLRMDAQWLARLKREILAEPFYPARDVMADLPQGRVKVALMLSKMTYGVDAEALKDTIRTLAQRGDVALAIKPHTRGMKFDFMTRNEIPRALVADRIPSALLSEWADIVLFTGSSVAYHAMLRRKASGFLKYCQRQPTAFDKGASAIVFESIADLARAIDVGAPFVSEEDQARIQEYLVKEVYAGDVKGATARRHYEQIMADLSLAPA